MIPIAIINPARTTISATRTIARSPPRWIAEAVETGVSVGRSGAAEGSKLGVSDGAGVGVPGSTVGGPGTGAAASGLCRSLTTIGRKRLVVPDASESPMVASPGSVAEAVATVVARFVAVGVNVLTGEAGVVGVGASPMMTWGLRISTSKSSPNGEIKEL